MFPFASFLGQREGENWEFNSAVLQKFFGEGLSIKTVLASYFLHNPKQTLWEERSSAIAELTWENAEFHSQIYLPITHLYSVRRTLLFLWKTFHIHTFQ